MLVIGGIVMYSKNKLSIVNGLCAGVLVWIILLISDYIDETVLDKGFFIGLIIYMITLHTSRTGKSFLHGLAVIVQHFWYLE